MGILSFCSLKGGVGKTSSTINVAHAFALRGCKTLIIDLDPSAHTTRFFQGNKEPFSVSLPNYLFGLRLGQQSDEEDELAVNVRPNLDLLPGGKELRHFLWGRGGRIFAKRFAEIVDSLKVYYDHVLIDTAPEYSVLLRNALAISDLVVVPVDASEMSIHSLEELISTASHIKRPSWAILRTMLNRRANRTLALSDSRLKSNMNLSSPDAADIDEDDYDVENPYDFMRMLTDWEGTREPRPEAPSNDRPIYLLRSIVYRSDLQNQLSFLGKTVHDHKAAIKLREEYTCVAKELEGLLSNVEEEIAEEVPLEREPERYLTA